MKMRFGFGFNFKPMGKSTPDQLNPVDLGGNVPNTMPKRRSQTNPDAIKVNPARPNTKLNK